MAQLFKGHVVDNGQYPIPAGMHGATEQPHHAASVNAVDIQRAAGDLERVVQMVAALTPGVESMAAVIQHTSQERGYSDGLAQAQAEVQATLMEAISVLTEAQNQRHAMAEQNESALADLALRIARKVIGAHLEADPQIVAKIVEETIAELEPSTSLVVHVNPADLTFVEGNRTAIERLVTAAGRVEIVADDSVARGGCVLVSPVGDVDARIETKLAVLETAFAAQRRQLAEGSP
jgi:flagellar assembly protein FliH